MSTSLGDRLATVESIHGILGPKPLHKGIFDPESLAEIVAFQRIQIVFDPMEHAD